jgi:hypothetical protein
VRFAGIEAVADGLVAGRVNGQNFDAAGALGDVALAVYLEVVPAQSWMLVRMMTMSRLSVHRREDVLGESSVF